MAIRAQADTFLGLFKQAHKATLLKNRRNSFGLRSWIDMMPIHISNIKVTAVLTWGQQRMKDLTLFSSVLEDRLTIFAQRYNQSLLEDIDLSVRMWDTQSET